MADEERMAVDMSRCGPWRSEGIKRWNVVDRSWYIYKQNTEELLYVLRDLPGQDPMLILRLVTASPQDAMPYWLHLDQRLHNCLAAATTLIDHTRRLTKYYEPDASDFVAEFHHRNDTVRALPQATFLRDLRNFLLHYETGQIIISLQLEPGTTQGIPHAIKLSGTHLKGSGWNWSAPTRTYLDGFEDGDGPVIVDDVLAYSQAMGQLFSWLSGQRKSVVPLNPQRFMIPWPHE